MIRSRPAPPVSRRATPRLPIGKPYRMYLQTEARPHVGKGFSVHRALFICAKKSVVFVFFLSGFDRATALLMVLLTAAFLPVSVRFTSLSTLRMWRSRVRHLAGQRGFCRYSVRPQSARVLKQLKDCLRTLPSLYDIGHAETLQTCSKHA